MSIDASKVEKAADEGAEAVLALCESQLLALEEETQLRFEKMADVAVAALGSAEAVANAAGRVRDGSVDDEVAALSDAIEHMTTEFQFFDEYAQRLQHVREAITLLRGQSFGRVDLELLKPILIRVFSLAAEQRGLAEHLPDFVAQSDDVSSSVELF